MKICIGGDLNGQVVEKDVYSFKATDIDPEKKSEYFIQSFILGDKRLRFWICFDIVIYAELSGDFPLGDSRQPTYKSLRP
ncbi:hypothetical protein ABTC57_07025, partial [Acinetobacter baumannii]